MSEQSPASGFLVSPPEVPPGMADALAGVRLNEADLVIVRWMRRQSQARIESVVAVLEKVRQAGYTEGYKDARDDGPDEPRTAAPRPDPS